MDAQRQPSSEPPMADRWALAAGIAFLDGAAAGNWGISGLRVWFQDQLVTPGYMGTPGSVHEPSVGTVTLWSRGAGATVANIGPGALLAHTRQQVLAALRGFLGIPVDDRFVKAALFSGRVQRASFRPTAPGESQRGLASRWAPRPDPTAPLHLLVLSLFAVDALTHREAWERGLCVCDVCGRVEFQDGVDRRRACAAHGPRPSAFMKRVVPPGDRA
jgi:hypothetical protein